LKTNGLYSKEEKIFQDKNKLYQAHSVKQIAYSTDPRDFGQVAKSIPCQEACPARTNIPGYIRCINEKRYGRAYELNRGANIMPGVLGRICSRPCETACRHGAPDNGVSVGICHLKRACADLKSPMHRIIEGLYAPSGKSVAVVGSGPAGLAAAHDLAILGHRAVVFETMEKPGGMLMYGIPEFRLPRDLLMTEINNILRLGVELKTGQAVGTHITLETLTREFDAVVVAAGCIKPRLLGVEGEDLENVYNGLDFMKQINKLKLIGDKLIGDRPQLINRINSGQSPIDRQINRGLSPIKKINRGLSPIKNVAVIGGGFTAVDCARSAIRLGAEQVTLYIRKTMDDMRIDETEKHEARFEGIGVESLVQPVRILGENGRVSGIEFVRTRIETTEKPPYKKSVPIAGSEFVVPCDSVIAALGQAPDVRDVSDALTGLDKDSPATGMKGVFAAGDFVTGSTDVISAIAGGRRTALAVDLYLTAMERKKTVVRLESHATTDRPRSYDFIDRVPMNTIAMDQRLADHTREVETGFDPDQAQKESQRCYLCSLKYEIDPLRCIYCSACIDVAPKDCIKMVETIPVNADGTYGRYVETGQWDRVVSITIDNEACIRCGQCYEVCPMDCISVTKTELIQMDMDE
jgi:NADPH-dependent glutamate synthase beta subunit-like oxidoreductase/ferredoxin